MTYPEGPFGPSTTGPWTDLGATTAEPPATKKPINIQRTMFPCSRQLVAGDLFTVTIWRDGPLKADRWQEVLPTFEIDKSIEIDCVTKFEVIDDFGVDVGIGFVLGKAKR